MRNRSLELIADCVESPFSRAIRFHEVNLSEFGFVKHNGEYENGFYPGQNDNPRDIFNQVKTPENEVIFKVSDVGQFDVHFECWIRPADWESRVEDT